ncbi:MAG: type II toxin-antitoxin system RelE/ParE family toxin [Candidatus Sulfotelmatobacter sp.]
MKSSAPIDAIVAWEGDSKEVISSFPDAAKGNLGFDLRLLQQGQQPTDFRPMSSIGPGVFELRDQDERAWYRVIYLSRVRGLFMCCIVSRSVAARLR